MHPRATVDHALLLLAEGHTSRQVAAITGVPRRTLSDWTRGKRPRSRPMRADPVDLDGLPCAYVYLLGIYLGDGCISRAPKDVYKLRVSLDAKYPEIIEEVCRATTEVMPRSKVHVQDQGTWFVVSSYSKQWPHLFPQHGPGRKHNRQIALTDWQLEHVHRSPELLLRGLIHSDGCRAINTGRGGWACPRYSFSNRSGDIRGIFCDACDLVGLRWTLAPYTVYVSRKDDVARMDEFIGPKA
jgi:hypothetical protein